MFNHHNSPIKHLLMGVNIMRKFLLKNNGTYLQNMMLTSAEIILFSLLVTWMIELLANEVLLRY